MFAKAKWPSPSEEETGNFRASGSPRRRDVEQET